MKKLILYTMIALAICSCVQDPTKDLLVNIGDEGEERWYHFDATVMRQDYAINSCLLTDAQLEAYSRLRSGFYRYDKSKYPTVESEIITENANLDAHIGQ